MLTTTLVAVLALPGCSSPAGSAQTPAAPPTSTGPVDTRPGPGRPPVPGTRPGPPSPGPTPTGEAAPVILLRGDGLGQLLGDASEQVLPFTGTPSAVVQQAVDEALGPTVPVALAPCPQGPRTAVGVAGFTVLLDGDRFVGWSDAGAPDRALTTSDGVGHGSRLDELTSALPDVQVVPAPTGAGWVSPTGLSGALQGVDPAAAVTVISGGETCAAA